MVFGWGQCPKMEVVKPFDVQKYMGRWYEITKFPNRFETGLRCIQANYSLTEEGKVKVENSGIKEADNTVSTALGEAIQAEEGTGALKVAFSKYAPYGDYSVIKTDYNNYACVHSCSSVLGLFHWSFFWILVRDRKYATEANMKSLIDFSKNAGVKVENLEATKNEDCMGR